MHRVGPWRKRRAATTTIRRVPGLLTVHHVGGNGQDRLRRHRIAVRRQGLDLLHKTLNQVAGNTVHAVIVVAVLGVLAFDDEIDRQPRVVAHRFDGRVFDSGQGIRGHGKASHAARHGAMHIAVVQRHQ